MIKLFRLSKQNFAVTLSIACEASQSKAKSNIQWIFGENSLLRTYYKYK